MGVEVEPEEREDGASDEMGATVDELALLGLRSGRGNTEEDADAKGIVRVLLLLPPREETEPDS